MHAAPTPARADVAALLRAGYLAASALILAIQAVPPLRSRFLAYGSRATPTSKSQKSHAAPATGAAAPAARSVAHALDCLAAVTVPHSYFTHFYAVSVLCSLFWAWSLRIPLSRDQASGRVQLAWLLMLLQGTRRIVESYTYTTTSKSRMWVGHWALGLLFYVTINVAIWIEETGQDLPSPSWDWKLATLAPAVLACHALQHAYHAYLYRLRTATSTSKSTYQLPSHPLFPGLLCPHYTCETLIYLLLSFLAAPPGRWVNWTLLCGTVFVAVNLGVTAIGTKEWYEQRFGVDNVRPRKRMVPFVW